MPVDAVVLDEITRVLRSRMAGEVGGSADHDETELAGDRH
jgi:hypothetical protein